MFSGCSRAYKSYNFLSGRLFAILGAFLRQKLLIHTYTITKKKTISYFNIFTAKMSSSQETHLHTCNMTSFGVWLSRLFFKSQRSSSLSFWLKEGIKQRFDRCFFTPLLERDRIIKGTQIVPASLIDYYLNKGPHFVWHGHWYGIFLYFFFWSHPQTIILPQEIYKKNCLLVTVKKDKYKKFK